MDLTFGNDGFMDKVGVCTSRIVGTRQYAMGRQDISQKQHDNSIMICHIIAKNILLLLVLCGS